MKAIQNDRIPQDNPDAAWLEVVCRSVANLRFGCIQITVHDGRVTVVESTEKTRFVGPRETRPSSAS